MIFYPYHVKLFSKTCENVLFVLDFLAHIQGGSLQGYSRMRDPSIKNLKPGETWHSYTLPNKDQKNI